MAEHVFLRQWVARVYQRTCQQIYSRIFRIRRGHLSLRYISRAGSRPRAQNVIIARSYADICVSWP